MENLYAEPIEICLLKTLRKCVREIYIFLFFCFEGNDLEEDRQLVPSRSRWKRSDWRQLRRGMAEKARCSMMGCVGAPELLDLK